MNTAPSPGRARELLFGLLFMAVALGVTLVVGEIAIRVISGRRQIYNIEMVKYATRLKMSDPRGEVSHVHRASAQARLMGVDVALNSLGHRGPELVNPKDPSRKRVFVLGSSVTLGWGVPFDSTFTARTESRLNTERPFGPAVTFEFANAGIGNYNTYFQSRLFAQQYPVVRPDLVVLHYFISDVQPRTMGRNNPILKYSFLAAFLFDRWSQLKLRVSGNYTDLITFYSDLYADTSQAWAQTQQQVAAMREQAARDSVPLVVMIIPDIHDLSPQTPYRPLYEKIESAFTAKGIATINTFGPFQQQYGSDVTRLWIQGDDPHPNASGHVLMADILYRYLVDANPLGLTPVSLRSN